MPTETWHFDYFLSDEEAKDLSGRAFGRTLISAQGTPLGFAGIYLDENREGQCVGIAFFYGGPNQCFARKYLPMVMRGIAQCIEILKDMGFKRLYAVADKDIPDADKFIKWVGGVRVDESDPHGPTYEIIIADIPFLKKR